MASRMVTWTVTPSLNNNSSSKKGKRISASKTLPFTFWKDTATGRNDRDIPTTLLKLIPSFYFFYIVIIIIFLKIFFCCTFICVNEQKQHSQPQLPLQQSLTAETEWLSDEHIVRVFKDFFLLLFRQVIQFYRTWEQETLPYHNCDNFIRSKNIIQNSTVQLQLFFSSFSFYNFSYCRKEMGIYLSSLRRPPPPPPPPPPILLPPRLWNKKKI